MPEDIAANVTARYIAPVSRYLTPSLAANALAIVDLPAPAGPSIATTIIGNSTSPTGVMRTTFVVT